MIEKHSFEILSCLYYMSMYSTRYFNLDRLNKLKYVLNYRYISIYIIDFYFNISDFCIQLAFLSYNIDYTANKLYS